MAYRSETDRQRNRLADCLTETENEKEREADTDR